MSEVTQPKKAKEAARTGVSGKPYSQERYQAFIQNSHEGIWLVELEKPISAKLKPATQIKLMYKHAYLAEANYAMAQMYGAESPESLIGTRLGELLVQDDPRNTVYLEAFIASGYALTGVDSHELDQLGNKKVFRNSLVGIVENGWVLRAWGTQQDITEQYEAQEALRRSQEHLALALKASRMGTWEWNVLTGELHWSDELKQLFGLDPEADITYEQYVSMLHPDDQKGMRQVIQAAMKNGKEYRIEHRTIWPDGSVHWIMGQGKAVMAGGRAVRLIGTSMDIDDLKRAEELKQINAVLETESAQLVALNQSKDEFISLASHQLRTPATAVKQYTGMLLQDFAEPLTVDQHKLLQIAYDSNERQLQIIDDLLRVAQVDAGKVALVKTLADIAFIIDEIVNEHTSVFEQRAQKMVFRRPAYTVQAYIDTDRLRMVLENIIDNAVKYSPSGAVTTVKVRDLKQHVVIVIEDQGVGIAKEDMPKLFQKFSRIDNVFSTIVGGTGIGLYWAKKIIDLHGGTIGIQSAPGKGSAFKIKLPK